MKYICPKCSREVYSRRNKTCGYCGELLPKNFAFSGAESKNVENQLSELEKRRIADKENEEAKKKPLASLDGGGVDVIPFM